jgi:hypothetical protein
MLDNGILKHTKTEYCLAAAESLLNKAAEVDKDIMVEVDEVKQAIQGGDEIHEQEVKLKVMTRKSNCNDDYEMFSADDLIEKLVTIH